MRSFLLQHGVPEEMIVGDFYARHTTTNLRNVRCSRRAVCFGVRSSSLRGRSAGLCLLTI